MSLSTITNRIKDLVLKGLYNKALELYKQELQHIPFPLILLPSIIKACSNAKTNHHFGLELHCTSIKTGSDSDTVVANSLISMYTKFSIPNSARKMFDDMHERDSITWSSMINCYVQNGYFLEALGMFKTMFASGFAPKPELIASIVSICGHHLDLRRFGRQIHARVVINGSMINDGSPPFLSSSFVNFYFKSNDPLMAFHCFNQTEAKNEVTWTAMISGLIENQNHDIAMDCYRAMRDRGIRPNRVTLTSVLPACAELGCNISHGKEIHGYAFRNGFVSDHHFSAALINMYSKSRDGLGPAMLIFSRCLVKDVVLWSSIISACSQSKDGAKAMKFFSQMRMEGNEPNSVTLLTVISACTVLSSIQLGNGVHGHVLKIGLRSNIFINNALMDMYAKCGSLHSLNQILHEISVRDSISYSTLISGYGLNGHGEEALKVFYKMKEEGIFQVDGITYLAILSACNHSGMVKEGKEIFEQVIRDEKVIVGIEHYACYIDLLGRAGKIEEACEVLRGMKVAPSTRIWSSLVSACKDHGRMEMAERLGLQLVGSEPGNVANYALLSMVYAESCEWVKVEQLRRVMRVRGLKKCYGFSQIEMEKGIACH